MSETKIPTAEELLALSARRKEKVVDYEIPEWGVTVKLTPISFGKYHQLSHDISLQFEKNPQNATLQAHLLWIEACLVEPKLSWEQAQQLSEGELGVMTKLAVRCREVSGDTAFSEDVEEAKNDLGADETTTDTDVSTPPASNFSESPPEEQL